MSSPKKPEKEPVKTPPMLEFIFDEPSRSVVCYEHEYYLDRGVSRSHCFFPTYKSWDEYLPDALTEGGRVTHIKTHSLSRS